MKVVRGDGIMPVTKARVLPSRLFLWWSFLSERQRRNPPIPMISIPLANSN
jgi:hypothetical protein